MHLVAHGRIHWHPMHVCHTTCLTHTSTTTLKTGLLAAEAAVQASIFCTYIHANTVLETGKGVHSLSQHLVVVASAAACPVHTSIHVTCIPDAMPDQLCMYLHQDDMSMCMSMYMYRANTAMNMYMASDHGRHSLT